MKKIFIYESNLQLAFSLKEILNLTNLEVDLFQDVEVDFEDCLCKRYDLYILELSIENKKESNMVNTLRLLNPGIPVLFLIAPFLRNVCLIDTKDGEPGYLIKPFGISEILTRINSIIYGSQQFTPGINGNFQVGRSFFDFQKRMLSYQDNIEILTCKEADLLALLVSNANTLVERTFILKAIWTENTYMNARSMNVYVIRLRKLLIKIPDVMLLTVHGKGYKLLMPLQGAG